MVGDSQIYFKNNRKYKLLVFDLDKTLLNNANLIDKKTKWVLFKAKEQGLKITIATGRMLSSALPYAREIEVNAPIIIYNGAMIVDIFRNNRILFESRLSYQSVFQSLKLLEEFKELHPNLYINEKVYIEQITELTKKYIQKDKVFFREVGNLANFLKYNPNPVKILIIGEKEILERFFQKFNELGIKDAYLVYSDPEFLEILPTNCSKGKALEKVARYLEIDREEVMAFGDYLNDLEMIKWAGLGVAMKNSELELKRVADYITVFNNGEGVCEVLEKFIF